MVTVTDNIDPRRCADDLDDLDATSLYPSSPEIDAEQRLLHADDLDDEAVLEDHDEDDVIDVDDEVAALVNASKTEDIDRRRVVTTPVINLYEAVSTSLNTLVTDESVGVVGNDLEADEDALLLRMSSNYIDLSSPTFEDEDPLTKPQGGILGSQEVLGDIKAGYRGNDNLKCIFLDFPYCKRAILKFLSSISLDIQTSTWALG